MRGPGRQSVGLRDLTGICDRIWIVRARVVVVAVVAAGVAIGADGGLLGRGKVEPARQAERRAPSAGQGVELRSEQRERRRASRPGRAIGPVLVSSVHIRSRVVALAIGDGSLWIARFWAVSRLDPATGRLVARIATPHMGEDTSLAFGDGSVWVRTGRGGGTVYRIDPSTNRVIARIHVGAPIEGIAFGARRVWLTRPLQGPGQVIRIDSRTNHVAGAPIQVGPGPGQVVYGLHRVWVQNTSPASVMRIDPGTGRVATVVGTRPVPYGSFVVGSIAIGYSSLWTVADNFLTRIDPRTSQVQARIRIPRAQDIAIAAGEVWVLAGPRSRNPTLYYPIKHTAALWQVDPSSNRVIAKPIRLNTQQSFAVSVSHNSVWVPEYANGTLTLTRFSLNHRSSRAR